MKWLRRILILCAMIFLVVFGSQTLAKIAWLLNLPSITLALTEDETVKGAALYKLGRYEEADMVFERIGRNTTYDRGMTLAVTGNYELSKAYFNAVLFADRWDEDAFFNREFVLKLYPQVIGKSNNSGRIAVMFEQAGIKLSTFDKTDPFAPLIEEAQREIRKPLDARSVHADEAWLDTLSDNPGEFLAKRFKAEQLRRQKDGKEHPPASSEW